MTRRAAAALGHRQAERAAVRHPAVTHIDYSARVQTVSRRRQPGLLRPDQRVRAADRLSGASSTRRSTCAASRSSAPGRCLPLLHADAHRPPGARAVPPRQDRATRLEGDQRMAAGIPARLTAAEGRRFGLTVGIAFLVLAGIACGAAIPSRSRSSASLGAVLVLAGLLVPTHLGPVERAWMGLAHLISRVTTPIFMGVDLFPRPHPVGCAATVGGPQRAPSPRVTTARTSTPGRGRRADPPISDGSSSSDQGHDMSQVA